MATFTLDATVGERRFNLDAWVIGSRWKHDRTLDHFGSQLDTTIVLDGAIGKYPDQAVLHDVLLDMVSRIQALEDYNHIVASPFTFDAFIQPHFWLDAVIFEAGLTNSFTLDSRLAYGTSFTLNAFLYELISSSMTFDAYLIDSPFGTWTNHTPTPAPDGNETIFTVPPYKAGTTTVYINGIPQTIGVDYVELNPDAGTIQFTVAPGVSDTIVVHALYCE